MRFGFVLRDLTVSGPGMQDAHIRFARGLNVIVGPSDTGKTFVAQCIDFALGSSTPPKEIPESARYTSIRLEIETQEAGRVYVIERSLRGGDIRLSTDGEPDRVLDAKHSAAKEDSISRFLLALSGLANNKVRTNQQGTTRSLSFRDIAPLILVDEHSVISEGSPVLSGQVIHETVEGCVFRLLLTGRDDSSVIANPDRKLAKGRREGKVELLEELLARARAEVASLETFDDARERRSQLARLDAAFSAAMSDLSAEQGIAAEQEERRRHSWTRLRQIESRIEVLAELQKRFVLLKAQYTSDLRRLEAIAEAGTRLGQLIEERCPICGALAEHHERQHQEEQDAPDDVAQACKAEAAKITKLLRDLHGTVTANADEIERLGIQRTSEEEALAAAGRELKTILQPRLQVAAQRLRDLQASRDTCRRGLALLERVAELEALLEIAKAPQKRERADGVSATVTTGEAEAFSRTVEGLLRAWRFPGLERVTFSEDDQDIVVSGRARKSHGKGVRAILRSAFNLALLDLCARESKPFPRMVLVDSPLVVYRQPDPGEDRFPHEVKQAFYRSIAESFLDCQVIILENDEPPGDVKAATNYIAFTGTAVDRSGFIPSQG